MISGRQALGSIDQALNQAHGEITGIERAISTATDQLLEQQKAQAADFRELARIRVERLADPGLIDQIDHAERQVLVLLADRDEASARLQQDIADAGRLREQH